MAATQNLNGAPVTNGSNFGILLTPEWVHIGGRMSIRIADNAIVTVPNGVELDAIARGPGNSVFYAAAAASTGELYRYDISTGPITSRTLLPGIWGYGVAAGQATGRLYNFYGEIYAPSTPSPEYYATVLTGRYGINVVASFESLSTPYTALLSTGGIVGIYHRDHYNLVYTHRVAPGATPVFVFFDNSGQRLYTVSNNNGNYEVRISNWTANGPSCAPDLGTQAPPVHRDGGLYPLIILASPDCQYTVQSSASWLRLMTPTRASGISDLQMFAETNRTGAPRTATITAGTSTTILTQQPSSADPGHKFGFEVSALAYRKANDTLLVTAPELNVLPIYDPATLQYSVENLPLGGLAVGVQPNGDYAAVGHAGFVSIVRLNPAVAPGSTVKVPLRVRGVALPGNGYLYAHAASDTRGLYWRNLTSGQEGFVSAPPSENSPMTVVPARKAIYWQGVKWDITNGIPVRIERVSNCDAVWANEAGTRTYGCAKAYIASDVPGEDGLEVGNISFGFVDHSASQRALAVVNYQPSRVEVWDDSTLTVRGSVPIPAAVADVTFSQGRQVFWSANGSTLYAVVIESVGGSAQIDGLVRVNPPGNCTYTLSPSTLAIPYTGGTGQLNVTTQNNCLWIATAGDNWTTLATASGSGSGPVTFSVAGNSSSAIRRISIRVGSQTAVITQAGNPGTLTASPQVLDVPATASSPTLTVTASNPLLGWRVQGGASFLSAGTGSATGSATLVLNVAANSGPARFATLSIGGVSVLVRQAGGDGSTLRFTSTGTILPGGGGTAQIALAATGTWTATSNATWLQISGSPSGNGNGAVTVAASVNPSQLARTALINVNGATYTVVQSGQQPLEFYPLAPCRVADTRNAPGPLGQPLVSAQTERTFPVLSSPCGVPADAVAYSMNVTVVPQGPLGYLTIYPAGEPRPVVSLLNSLDGRIKANSTVLRAGPNGGVTVFATGTTHVLLDINGYFAPRKEQGLGFRPVLPSCRILDSRNPNGPRGGPALQAGVARTIAIAGNCSIPASAKAYALNITAIPRTTLGYLTVWPTGQPQPVVSTLNAPTGAITANGAITVAGSNGSIDVFANGDTDLLVDVTGYFDIDVAGAATLPYYTINPCRMADTRLDAGGQPMDAGENRLFEGTRCGTPLESLALTLNATVVPSGSFGYLTLYSPVLPMPLVSTLNAVDGAITSNSVLVPTSVFPPVIRAFTSSPTHLLLDVTGYFSPALIF
ncbi:hypothetical protein F183_A08080 [Bryobacterales bacterium F-183]|nr:hypothetical protein F183_A08080 [Bryobacterales bacterium F-183]